MKATRSGLTRRSKLVAALAVPVAVSTVALVVSHPGAPAHHHALAAERAVVVSTALARSGSLAQAVPVEGIVVAKDALGVTPSQSGQVQRFDVHVGQAVSAGQELVSLSDTSGLAHQLAAARAALAADLSSLGDLEDPAASVSPTALQAAQARVSQAQSALDQAQVKQTYDQRNAAAAASVASPIDGVVQAVDVADGQTVGAGSPIAQVSPAGEAAQVNVEMADNEASAIVVGTPASVSVLGGATMQGSVSSISAPPAGAPSTGANGTGGSGTGGSGTGGQPAPAGVALVAISVPGAPSALLAGSLAEVSVPLPSGTTAQGVGTLSYPGTVTLLAQAPGTIASLVAKGSPVSAGQAVAALADPAASQLLVEDRAGVAAAQASVASAQAALSNVEHPQPAAPAAIAAMQAKVAADRQGVAHAQADLAALKVSAPFAGVVTERLAAPGQMVTPSTRLVELVSNAVEIQASVPVGEVTQVRSALGSTAAVEPATASPGPPLLTTVGALYPAANPTSQLFTVVLTPKGSSSPGALSVGEPVKATLEAPGPTATVVPSSAITYPTGTPGVFTVSGGVARLRTVSLGVVSGALAEVRSGLRPGEEVVTAGQSFLAPGDHVRASAPKAPA